MAGPDREGNRRLRDAFDTRRLADRLEDVKLRGVIGEDDRAFIESLDTFFLATARATSTSARSSSAPSTFPRAARPVGDPAREGL